MLLSITLVLCAHREPSSVKVAVKLAPRPGRAGVALRAKGDTEENKDEL